MGPIARYVYFGIEHWPFRVQCGESPDADTLIDGEGGNESDGEFIRRLGGDNKEERKQWAQLPASCYAP